MSKTKFTRLSQGEKKYRELQNKFRKTAVTSFRGAVDEVERTSLRHLDQMVYSKSRGANTKAGTLRGSERIRMVSETEAHLVNDAVSVWKGKKTNYARVIAKGRKAMSKARGFFVWMKDQTLTRPTSPAAWREAFKQGLAIRARRVRAVAAKPWRERAFDEVKTKGVFAKFFAAKIEELNKSANRNAGGGT